MVTVRPTISDPYRPNRAILVIMAYPFFQVIPQPDHSFNVRLTTADGRLKTITGVGSEHEAAAWGAQTVRMLHERDPSFVLPSRNKSHS